jgi:hypothetical protein
MKSLLRRLAAITATALALPASASTLTPHYTDLWYLPTESGWGVNVIQQYDTIFATLFVYGPDNQPRWYVGPAVRTVGASQTQFTGQLFSTVGSPFGTPWSPSAYSFTQVGNISFNFSTVTAGSVTYTIDNVTVTKPIVRQSWGANILTGNYYGGLTANGFNCRNGVQNGPVLINGEMTINHTNFFAPTFRVALAGTTAICTFTGPYMQEGRLGSIFQGTWSCVIPNVTNPPIGVFTITQLEATQNGFTSRFTGSDQNCEYTGYFGGVKDVL